ncbi:hypothetical protein FB639_003450, partial [Coemansia asiatica]
KFVLLNMTTNEYVRASDIPNKYDLNFGHIVILQACWSSDPSMSIHYDKEIHRGPWAGHCFKITTIDNLDKDAKDVSTEVVSKVVDVFDQDSPTLS